MQIENEAKAGGILLTMAALHHHAVLVLIFATSSHIRILREQKSKRNEKGGTRFSPEQLRKRNGKPNEWERKRGVHKNCCMLRER